MFYAVKIMLWFYLLQCRIYSSEWKKGRGRIELSDPVVGGNPDNTNDHLCKRS